VGGVPAQLYGQAIAAVALAHALLLPLLTGGWISAFAYGLAALGLSSAAVAVVRRRWRARRGIGEQHWRVSARARNSASLCRYEVDRPTVCITDWIKCMSRRGAGEKTQARTRQAELENAASRNLAKQLTRSPTDRPDPANWEWERASNGVACSGEVLRILG